LSFIALSQAAAAQGPKDLAGFILAPVIDPAPKMSKATVMPIAENKNIKMDITNKR
jgi:hypothetical protein